MKTNEGTIDRALRIIAGLGIIAYGIAFRLLWPDVQDATIAYESATRGLIVVLAIFPLAFHARTRSAHFASVPVIHAIMRCRDQLRKAAASCSGYRSASPTSGAFSER